MPESIIDLGAPVPVKDRPQSPPRGGRAPIRPAYIKWLEALQPGAEYEMASKDEDKAHSVSRLNGIRSLIKELNADEKATRVYMIDAVPVVPNKRYRIFGSVAVTEAAANGKAAKPA